MGKMYINGIGCISAQQTAGDFPAQFEVNETTNFLPLHKPEYKDYFSPIASRRMAKGVKNGIVASTIALKEAGLEKPDIIITGTGMGCIEDSDKFLKSIIDNNEEFLTPTSFIQSTHNTVGAQIALGLECKGYNFTYVNGAVSFESALIDAKLQFDNDEINSALIGGLDEMTDYTQSLFKLAGFIKKDGLPAYETLGSKTAGAIFSEGATFFVLQQHKTETTYAEIVDIETINRLEKSEVGQKAIDFLKQNNLTQHDIDAIVLGFNGDAAYDDYYKELALEFAFTPQLYYKHVSGEYNTASAFGLYVAANLLQLQEIPQQLKINDVEKASYHKLLLYNQYRGIDHSFTLISI
jgi:3-oxoacyl-(acyl-carrier-protein) synthase